MPTFEITAPDGARYHIEGPPGATEQDALAQVQAQHGAVAQADLGGDSSTIGDIAKSFGSGLVRGAAGLAGLPGDVAEYGTQGINYLLGTNLKNKVPLASTATVLDRLQQDYGQLHKPEGIAGEYAQTLGDFVPGMLLPGSAGTGLARKVATNVVAPALASETAGQLTKGTAAEPIARFAGGVAGGLASAKLGAPKPPAGPTLEDIGANASRLYQSPAVTDVRFDPAAVKSISDQAIGELRRARFNDGNADKTFGILEDLKTPVGPVQGMSLPGAPYTPGIKASVALQGGAPLHSYEDFQNARTQLSKLAGKLNDPVEQAAASKAIGLLDRSLLNVSQNQLRAGSAQALNDALTEARADYAVAKTGQRVEEKLRNADLQAASANSGANVNNATRQKLRPLLTTQKGQRGFTEDEISAIEAAVRGSPTGNLARTAGNLLGGGGGLGAMVTGMSGFVGSGGNPLGLAAPGAGYSLKKIGDALTKRKAAAIIELIKQRSPTMQRHLASIAGQPKPGLLPWPVLGTSLLGTNSQ